MVPDTTQQNSPAPFCTRGRVLVTGLLQGVVPPAVTVTAQVAVLPPSTVVTVMVAEPAATAVTTPVELTVATLVLLLLQVTFLLVALAGDTVAVRVAVCPTVRLNVVGDTVTPVTGTVSVTVMAQVAVLAPSTVVTVMVAEPVSTAVTTPVELTVATLVLLLLQVTFLLVALAGDTVAVRVAVCPTVRLNMVGDTVTPVTGTVSPGTGSLPNTFTPSTYMGIPGICFRVEVIPAHEGSLAASHAEAGALGKLIRI